MPFNDSTNLNHVSKYIVDANGGTPYSTIQSALDAANAAGIAANIVIRPGTYTENLTLYDNIAITGTDSNEVIITGTHTPPTSGDISINSCTLTAAAHILSSVASGSTNIAIEDCFINLTAGFIFHLANWNGNLNIIKCRDGSTSNGIINNTSGSVVNVMSSEVGAAPAVFTTSGNVKLHSSTVNCDTLFAGVGPTVNIDQCTFLGTVSAGGGAVTAISNSIISTGASSAILHGSTGTFTLSDVTINSSANPCITGAGAGNLILGSVTYLNNSNIAGALTKSFATRLETGELKLDDAEDGVLFASTGVANSTGAMTNGQLVIGSTGVAPVAASLTSTGSTIAFTPGAGSLNLETNVGIVQTVYNSTSSFVAANTVVMPSDDSIPQQTEGTEILTATITPTNASNLLYILFSAPFGVFDTVTTVIMSLALFQDATANALAACYCERTTVIGVTSFSEVSMSYRMVAGTTSPTTFKFRMGPNVACSAGGINGDSSRKFGGAANTSITIYEIQP